MFPCPKKRFDQARNDHITYKKTAFHFVKQTSFKKVIEKPNCVLQKKIDIESFISQQHQQKLYITIEGARSIKELIL